MVFHEHVYKQNDPRNVKPRTDREQKQLFVKRAPSKQGAGGKYVWGSLETELKEVEHLDAQQAELVFTRDGQAQADGTANDDEEDDFMDPFNESGFSEEEETDSSVEQDTPQPQTETERLVSSSAT